MIPLSISILLVLLSTGPGPGSDAARSGRSGNKAYEKEQFDEAARHYRSGLEAIADPGRDRIVHGLLHNLGSAEYRRQAYQEADEAFRQAMAAAPKDAEFTASSYNAGNAAFRAGDLERALDLFKGALLLDPSNEDAKFNYEFVKRQLDKNQQSQGGSQNEDSKQQQKQEESEDNEGDQKKEEEQDQEQQQDDSKQEEGNQEQTEEQEGGQESEPQPDENAQELSREQAERIIEALQNNEKELLKEARKMKGRARRVEKDW